MWLCANCPDKQMEGAVGLDFSQTRTTQSAAIVFFNSIVQQLKNEKEYTSTANH